TQGLSGTASMTTVRQSTIELLRTQGLTTWFGNPGSSELTLLEEFPDDFRYFLGLQEMIPVGMADGFAQISRRPAIVNLHTAPGLTYTPRGGAKGARGDLYFGLPDRRGLSRRARCRHDLGAVNGGGSVDGYR